ncbi:MAG: methyltransferase domain-containing protein [Candidatus Dormibacteraeota bacterium]|nr:methyltransferase domain-containing protein [Candidatus Dormibacteraeota bacterium]MBV9524236.1 methyltransferase domain-containing protein [Candidatus Dormibacteraeota bacterium]
MTGAYAGVADAWAAGPARVYDVLAERIVAHCPDEVAGSPVLDAGAGTGAASRALLRRGARPTGVDSAPDMVASMRAAGITAVVGDLLAMPFEDASFDGAVAAFAISHVEKPQRALAEMRRVVRRGGFVVSGGFAAASPDESKTVIDAAAMRFGYEYPEWYLRFKEQIEPLVSDPVALTRFAQEAGLGDARVVEETVDTGVREPEAIVAARLGMAHVAPWVATLTAEQRTALVTAAVRMLGPDPAPIRRTILVLTGVVP